MSMKRAAEDSESASGDVIVSLQDIINEDNELETTANAVLGGSDDQTCTYSDGYVPRQALYACSTCKTDGYAGICLACSLECHDGHELYELYTKRNFRCDCGNSKFPDLKCSLASDKEPVNEKNLYNHNFNGTYCTCHRPYPDPEDDVDDEMTQCVSCEDWFHSRHLLGKPPPACGYAEMICHECMKNRLAFLWYYNLEYEENDSPIDVCSIKEEPEASDAKPPTRDEPPETIHSIAESKSKQPEEQSSCLLINLQKKHQTHEHPEGASFWSDDWRMKLCSCRDCKIKMREFDFLLSADDTVAEYEKKGASKHTESSVDSGMRALGEMNHVQQVEVIQGYNDMKSRLSEFLRMFAEQGKVVTEEDIRSFFQRMSEAKRRRVDIPYTCK